VNLFHRIYDYFFYWKARRITKRLLDIASQRWMKTATMEPCVVETLEGLRGIVRPGMMNSKLVRVVGTFDVHSPIEVETYGTVYDFEDCILNGKAFPVLVSRGYMNCFNGVFINVDVPKDVELAPFEALQIGQEPSGASVIAGYADTGSAFIDLSIFNAGDLIDEVLLEMQESSSCPATGTDAPESMLG
jgi:hypothetical protein